MNTDSEQITLDKSLVVAQDQPLDDAAQQECLCRALGMGCCRVVHVKPRRWAMEYSAGGKTIHMLVRSCTYLGNPHPKFKKRVQLPLWFADYCHDMAEKSPDVDVRYIGLYHYGDEHHGDNVVFIDFAKDTYLSKKGHNSSAHVYVNDLFQAMTYGVFRKEDASGNTITTVRRDKLADYLVHGVAQDASLFTLFQRFNSGFTFGEWLRCTDTIRAMHDAGWGQWRQAEWPGWFLEYRFDKFTRENGVTDKMRYIGGSNKREGELDFDIRFDEADFYGDLKASDIVKTVTPGNDKRNFVECVYRYDRFWYVIFEHDTEKDSERDGYEATRERNRYIKSVDPTYANDELSYSTRMKSRVRFVRMMIVELNRINYRSALVEFHQGHQADGSPRAIKFNIKKKDMDNYVVFRHSYRE